MKRKLYRLDRRRGERGASLYLGSHDLHVFKSGEPFDADFEVPVRFTLDEALRQEALPTFFVSPAWVVRRELYDELRALGVDNLQAYDALIEDPVDGRVITDYLCVNVVGRASCVDRARARGQALGPGMLVLDELVLDSRLVPELDVFLVAEDTDIMIVSQRVHDRLRDRSDVFLAEVTQTP